MHHHWLSSLGIEHPLIQAPLSGSTTPALVAEVSGAGGLGSLGAGYMEPQAIIDDAARIRTRTERPFNINLFVLPDDFDVDMAAVERLRARLDALMEREGLDVRTTLPAHWAPRFSEQFAALCEVRPGVASFTFGVLSAAQLQALKRLDIVVVGTATTVDEAQAWAELGADAICVQGAEAGGHRGSFLHEAEDAMIGLFALLPLTVRAMATHGNIPVIAAGGIMDGRGMAAAEALGAAASMLGTAFLACPECSAAPAWKHDLQQAEDHRITTIRSFSGRAARGLRNTYVDAMPNTADELLPYPVLNALTSPLRRAAAQAGRGDLLSEWCGQAASLSRSLPAAQLVAALMHEYRLAKRAMAG